MVDINVEEVGRRLKYINRNEFLTKSDLIYEKLVKKFGRIIKISIKDKRKLSEFQKIQQEIFLNITLNEVYSFAIFTFLLSSLIGAFVFALTKDIRTILLFLIIGLLSLSYFVSYPKLLFQRLRNEKRNQLLLLIMLVAMKLRANSNLENALEYATEYISYPLKADILKLLWDTYVKKYYNITEAIDYYLKGWEDEAPYFVHGMQLLISSTFEVDKVKKEEMIDKAVEITLEMLYEKMSYVIRELQSPINMVYMMGIVLPTMLLTIFPLASMFLPDLISSRFLFTFFDLAVPLLLLIVIKYSIEPKRLDVLSKVDPKLYEKLKKERVKTNTISILASITILIIILFGVINHISPIISSMRLASVIYASLFILSIGLSIATAYRVYYSFFSGTDKMIDKINMELSSFLFSLGTVMQENVPLENALIRIYPRLKKRYIGKFILDTMKTLRMYNVSIRDAIFDKKIGVIYKYPSSYLRAVMEIIVESSYIDPKTAAKSAIALSRYFMYIERVNLKLLDLTAEVVSQMKSLARVIGPMILGVVVGMAIMSTNIMYNLGLLFKDIQNLGSPTEGFYTPDMLFADIMNIFGFEKIISPSIMYIIVGIYNIIIAIIIAYLTNFIENGGHPIKHKKYVGDFLLTSSIMYFLVGAPTSIGLWLFADMLIRGIMI